MTVPLKDMKVGHRYVVKYGYEKPGGYKRRKLHQGVATLVKKGYGARRLRRRSHGGYRYGGYRQGEPHRFQLPDGTKVWVSMQCVLSHEGEDPAVTRQKSLDKEMPKKQRKQTISTTLMYLSAFDLTGTRDADETGLTISVHDLAEFNKLIVRLLGEQLNGDS